MLRICLWRMLSHHLCKVPQTVINIMGLDDCTDDPSSSHMIDLAHQHVTTQEHYSSKRTVRYLGHILYSRTTSSTLGTSEMDSGNTELTELSRCTDITLKG